MSQKQESIAGVILAAGKGKRMQSTLPKVLHSIAGKAMLEHVVDNLQEVPISQQCLVLGNQLEAFDHFLAKHPNLNLCIQHELNGTGGAVAATAASFIGVEHSSFASSHLERGKAFEAEYILICTGDCPAIQASLLKDFIDFSLNKKWDLSVLGMKVHNPYGYGRLVTDQQQKLLKIVEEKDANEKEKKITACNSGVVFGKTKLIFSLLKELKPQNKQGEYYLTDCFEHALQQGMQVGTYLCDDWQSLQGVNTPEQLSKLAQYMQTTRATKN